MPRNSPPAEHHAADDNAVFTTYGDLLLWDGMPVARLIESTTILGGCNTSAKEGFKDFCRTRSDWLNIVPMPTPRGK